MRRITKPLSADKHAARQPKTVSPADANSRRLFLLVGAILGPIVLLVLYYKTLFPGLTSPDALDFAQIGRNIAAGKGFTTFLLRPLALTHGNSPINQPDGLHGPLYPLCLAVVFGALGARDNVVAGVSCLFFLLTIPTLYFLGKRAFGDRVGAVAALVFAISAMALEYATSGMHVTLCIFLTTALLLAAYPISAYVRDAPGAPATPLPQAALAMTGALTALLYLAEPTFFWIIPAVGLTILSALKTQRGKAAFWFCAPLLALTVPWMARNAILTGNPIFGLRGSELWMNTRHNFPGMTAYRMLPTEIFPGRGMLQDMMLKFAAGINTVLSSWPGVGGNWVLVFFLPSLFFRFNDAAVNLLRRILLNGFVLVTIGMLFFQVEMALLVVFVPGMLIFSVAYLMFLVQQAQFTREATVRLTVLLTAALFYPVFNELALAEKPTGIREREAALALSTRSRPGDVVLTDQPWTVAWYANRPAMLVPYTDATITDMRQRFSGLRWLFLSQAVSTSGPEWRALYQGLLQWNTTYAAATARSQQPPAEVRIGGAEAPLLAALTGFVTYPPLEKATPATVVAFAPPMASGLVVPPTGRQVSRQ